MAAVRAVVTRRANRRIIMRQVGDRLIPVGVTSGRVHALSPEEAASAAAAASENGNGSWRSRRRQQAAGNGLEQYLGQDLEEVCLTNSSLLSPYFSMLADTANDDGGDEVVVDRARGSAEERGRREEEGGNAG